MKDHENLCFMPLKEYPILVGLDWLVNRASFPESLAGVNFVDLSSIPWKGVAYRGEQGVGKGHRAARKVSLSARHWIWPVPDQARVWMDNPAFSSLLLTLLFPGLGWQMQAETSHATAIHPSTGSEAQPQGHWACTPLTGKMLPYNPDFGKMEEKIFHSMASWGFMSEGPADGIW